MLENIQYASQYANPYVIRALTRTHGLYMNVYDKDEPTVYDEGRDIYISNPGKYKVKPRYDRIKLLLNKPVQETFDSGEESFDSFLEDTYIITCDKSLVFNKLQKFEIFYNKTQKEPVRVMQCFEVREFSNSYNQWSVRHVMLKPFN